ncbi:Dna2/Cas4 domain-containing protein [Paenibacillus xylanexedens]|uniref:Dna2/Cas4 domain-containing protein n=1 Tax=Paenibacillus xylanexedens TaxID=528191 RepID=UPI0011A6A3EC|nr:Dna2/Cas4 domain-containing protein [Paenibacillus xylanexedens]
MSLKDLAKKIKAEQKERTKTPEEKFLSALDKFLERVGNEERPSRLAFNPSSIYKCQREIWYKLKGVKNTRKNKARGVRILEVGTQLHEWVQRDVFMRMNEEADSPIKLIPLEEIPVYGQEGIEFIKEHKAPPMELKFVDSRHTRLIPISAMTDGTIEFDGSYMVFEFKTINPDDFKFMIEPLKNHIKQGAVYSLCLGIPYVIFVYFCKGTQNWKAYRIEYTTEQHDWLKAKLHTIEDYYEKDELPPPEKSAENCRYCPYKKLCDAELKGTE